ncbi:MAG: RES family NAD+ phosphorylase [Okeania sp. SIO2H7]|nr:RES family NAD+ phosphorylase [Okeania sp. SIO2H7]
MLTVNELIPILAYLPTVPAGGVASRSIAERFADTPLSTQGPLIVGGRYNPPRSLLGGFGALYLADTADTARREVKTLVDTAVGLYRVEAAAPRIEFSIEYQFNSVLDITDPNIQTAVGTNLQELTGLWIPFNSGGDIAPTQVLGVAAHRLQTIEALKVYSVYGGGRAYNIVAFTDRLFPGSFLRAYDESGTMSAQLP